METSLAVSGFPDPALVINYPTALRFVRFRLNRMAHGQMKPWSKEHRFNYVRLVEIKKDDRQLYVPLVQRLLAAFGYDVAVIRLVSTSRVKNHFFWFSSPEAHALFCQELRTYDQLVALASQ
ncbi:hypothetical protein HNQ93_004158 [Hymenobacter luteus]|uniref:Uncharacterized protein n=2 Tax=Hymenobacter TaxID=89966 RepID=A0A7W9T6F7_9BACT|nr:MULTISPECIES: hypothetical protein [Hymenobacter]MBB4603548.1 hypothetical protein [Hymenobacter latericoloratus]MBB6061279.1 hypothetical protein [Hymenobacter luteus]